ncbi:MAG TPA: hypothetical protein VHA53_06595 [Nitrolancea sp.]|nr:hypothetical protein [Nitrolancea sp.]
MSTESEPSAEEFLGTLRRAAEERYGAERAAELDGRLQNSARWLALIAAAPLDFAADPPDCSGLKVERQ